MKNRNFPWAIVALAAVAGAGFAGVANYVRHHDSPPVSSQSPDEPGTVLNVNSPKKDEPAKAANDATNQDIAPKASKADALNKTLKDKNYGEFRVLNVVVEDNGNAIIDFNKELLGGMGSGAESEFIDILKSTLAKYDDVKTFQIRIEGEIQKSLSHFEMIDPVPVR